MSAQPQPQIYGRTFDQKHWLTSSNLRRALGTALHGHPCTLAVPDSRVGECPGMWERPDVVVFSGQPSFVDHNKLLNPVFAAEVLSPSTEAYDRGFKSAQYRTLESLQEYALISQSEPRVEVFRRASEGHWLLSEFVGLEARCRFESIACEIPLSEIYDKILFGDEEPMPR